MEVLLLYLDKVFPTWVVICKANFSKAFHFTVCAGHIGFHFFLKEHFYFSDLAEISQIWSFFGVHEKLKILKIFWAGKS